MTPNNRRDANLTIVSASAIHRLVETQTTAHWLLELLMGSVNCEKAATALGPRGVIQVWFTPPVGVGLGVVTPYTIN